MFEEAVILRMRADPEPRNLVIVQKTKGTVSEGHTNGVAEIGAVHFDGGPSEEGVRAGNPVAPEARMKFGLIISRR